MKISLHIDPRSIVYADRLLLLPVKNDGKTTDTGAETYGIGASDKVSTPPMKGFTGFRKTIPLFSAVHVPSVKKSTIHQTYHEGCTSRRFYLYFT